MKPYDLYVSILSRSYETTVLDAPLVVLMWGFSELHETQPMEAVVIVFNQVMALRRKHGKPFATHTDLQTQSEVIGDINHA